MRKQPTRTCAACRSKDGKWSLVRVVRLPDAGGVVLDPTGKRAGRGAYLCASDACLTLAFKKGGLARTLKCKVPSALEAEIHDHFKAVQPASPAESDPSSE
jgi:predicted RNA-binding protein YlxR (DUF448 family)